MVQTANWTSAVASLRGRGLGSVDRHPGQRQSGYDLGGYPVRSRLLAGYLFVTAEADAGIRARPRADSRAMDLVTRRKS